MIPNPKPRSQIGRIGIAPPRAPNAVPAKSVEGDQSTASQSTFGLIRPSVSRPQSGHVEAAKPRSLLPQPGQHRYNTRSSILPEVSDDSPVSQDAESTSSNTSESRTATPTAQEKPAPGAVPGRLRARTAYQNGSPSLQRADSSDKASAPRSMRPPASVSKPTEPQAVGLSRTQSLRKPATASQPAPISRLTGHARTKSAITVSAAQKEAPKSIPASDRPKSLMMPPSRNSKTQSASAETVPAAARTSGRIAGLSRTASTKVKSEATSGESSAAGSRPEEPKKTSRPAFSTLQQHFTPRKVGKAPTSTFINPAPQPAVHALPPEMVNIQSELLQLHLLHKSSAEVSRCWEQSAKRSLHHRFEEVASLYQIMLENERAGQEQKNLQSLLEWTAGGSSGLVEHIQILSEPLHELPSLVESGGRLQRLIADFEHWLLWVQDIRSARQNFAGDKKALGTIEGLRDSWKAENAALIRKLTGFSRDLERLATPSPGSSIACILEACTSIIRGTLDELQTMQKIEAEVVTKEKDWVENRLRVIARDVGMSPVDADRQAPAWRI
ncbi:hypothetical protein Ptr902_10900 [Pyrenophora tritici-repentis]|nr:hypothetical protein Ptr902_10900 [Pyrenophora tritici-repentis]